jgi:hypothetical protein
MLKLKVRDVLDRLPGSALIPLSRASGLVISGRVEDFRAALAKHYGRRVADLLRALRRSDLSKLFRRPFELDEVEYRLRNRGRYSKAELLEMSLSVFVRSEVHEALSTTAESDEEDDEDDEEAQESDEETEESDEDEDEEDSSEVEIPAAVQELLGWLHEGRWSGSRMVRVLLSITYGQQFTRLRTERFHRLLEDLHRYGVEMCFEDDRAKRPLALDADSPGLDALVCLRLRAQEEVSEAEEEEEDEKVAPVTSRPLPRHPAPAPKAPPTVSTVPLQPVRVIPDPAGRSPATSVTKTTPYELALLRLEFLTAAPSIDRARDPMWPDAFLDAATRGIDLDERSRRFLRLAANTFVSGSHDPTVRVTRLTRVLHANDWPLLLLDFERLNPDAAPELVDEVIRHASELASLPFEPVAKVVVSPDPRPRPRPEVSVPPRAASPSREGMPRDVPTKGQGGERNLGALKGMFDD